MYNWLVPVIAVFAYACFVALTIKACIKHEYVLVFAALAKLVLASIYVYIWVTMPATTPSNYILFRDFGILFVVFTGFVSNVVYLATYRYKKTIERDSIIKALASLETKYYSIVEMSPIAIYAFEPNSGKIKFVNKALLSLLGYKKEDLLHKGVFDVIAEEDHALVRQKIRSRIEAQEDITDYQLGLKSATGEIVTVRVVGRIVHNGEVSILGYAIPVE